MAVPESLSNDERGQTDVGTLAKFAIAVVVALTVAGLLAAVMLPVALDQIEEDRTTTITQDTGTTENVTAVFDATLDSTNTSADTATYTLDDVENSSDTNTVDNGTTTTFSLDSGDVDVTVDNVESDSATATYTYATTHGWSTGATGLWGILALLLVLTVFLFVLGVALKAMEGV